MEQITGNPYLQYFIGLPGYQDISLLNEAREKLEYMIYRMCKTYGLQLLRRYRRRARKDYLAFSKSRKHTKKQIQSAIRKQLFYVRRDIGYLERYFSQLWIRPIVRGKVKAPVEFVAKLAVSIDEEGYGRLEKVSFDAYNESGCLIGAVERYKSRTGHYPERVLADQIYRTRDNRAYCKKHGIRLSGPKLGRPSLNAQMDRKQEYQDNTDRIEVERFFSRNKRCYGLGCIVTKLEETQLTSIALSVFVSNLFKIQRRILLRLFWQCLQYVTHIGGYSLKTA